MQSIQTSHLFSLSDVKPLEGLLRYREYCLKATRKAFSLGSKRRDVCLIDGGPLESWGLIGEFEYRRCPKTGSLFLAEIPSPEVWSGLLTELSQYRNSPQTFHLDITKSRLENVFRPKLEWIQDALRLQGVKKPKILEAITPPSHFTSLLQGNSTFSEVLSVNEMDFVQERNSCPQANVAVLLESLDRVSDPQKLLQGVSRSLTDPGLIFITALVSSGFDMTVLGTQNAYLYPPDRTNCFSLDGLKQFLTKSGFSLLEVSTPGVLDVEVVKAHLKSNFKVSLSHFEKQILSSDVDTLASFQAFLQQCGFSSFARIVAKKI